MAATTTNNPYGVVFNQNGGATSTTPYGAPGAAVPGASPAVSQFYNGAGGVSQQVGNFGAVAAQAPGAQDPAQFGGPVAPNVEGSQDYGDYQNFGTTAQQYGALAGQALNGPAVQQSTAGLGALAAGQGTGQQGQAAANAVAANIAAGNSLGQGAQKAAIDVAGLGATGQTSGEQQQAAANALLLKQANGTAPSAADIQMQQGIQQGVANAQSQAGSTRGNFGLANAQKQAAGAAAEGSQALASQGAVLRAQEMATGAGQLSAGAANLAGSENQGASNLTGAAGGLAGSQTAGAGLYGQGTGALAASQQNAANAFNAAALAQQGQTLGYYTGQQAAAQGQSAQAAQLATANLNAALGQGTQNIQEQQTQNQQTQAYAGAGTAALGALGAAALASDERLKRDVAPNAATVMEQLDHFRPHGFSYRSTSDTPNREAVSAPQVGVLAQDVERGPAGRMLVGHRADGAKVLDVPSMTGVLAAGEGALKGRSDEHEDRIARLEKLLRAA